MKSSPPPAKPNAPYVEAGREAARSVGLIYLPDTVPGYRRVGRPGRFQYLDTRGRPLKQEATLRRIRSLVIPPAWTDVWISPQTRGHLQASGRDARRRKQYRYHNDWAATRDNAKFEHVMGFARALPRLRRAVARDLRRPKLGRERVLAAVVRLLETTLMRIGNEEYAQANHSYGLTTLRVHHVNIAGPTLKLNFKGKSGVRHRIALRDIQLAALIRKIQELPGQELFQYLDEDGKCHKLRSDDVNAYIREHAGEDYTAKDFRTWAATVLCAVVLGGFTPPASATEAKRNVVEAIRLVARRIGNTPTVCRKSYIHPAIVEGYLAGEPPLRFPSSSEEKLDRPLSQLPQEHAAVLAFLKRHRPHRAASTAAK